MRFAKDALKISRLLMDFKSQHETLLNAVVIYPRPKIETAILYSKDAVFHRLDDMLTDRIKSIAERDGYDLTGVHPRNTPTHRLQSHLNTATQELHLEVVSRRAYDQTEYDTVVNALEQSLLLLGSDTNPFSQSVQMRLGRVHQMYEDRLKWEKFLKESLKKIKLND